jgi:hypothetical protein
MPAKTFSTACSVSLTISMVTALARAAAKISILLRKHGVIATLRREKGHDIAVACGQLRLQTMELRDQRHRR